LARATLHVKAVKIDPNKPGSVDVSYDVIAVIMNTPDVPILGGIIGDASLPDQRERFPIEMGKTDHQRTGQQEHRKPVVVGGGERIGPEAASFIPDEASIEFTAKTMRFVRTRYGAASCRLLFRPHRPQTPKLGPNSNVTT
jgi:hypothetical protein